MILRNRSGLMPAEEEVDNATSTTIDWENYEIGELELDGADGSRAG